MESINLDSLSGNFIALVDSEKGEKLVNVIKVLSHFKIDNITYSLEQISKVFKGIVLVISKAKINYIRKVTTNSIVNILTSFSIITLTICLLFLRSINFSIGLLIFTSIVGIYLSIEVFRQTIGEKSIISGLCNISLNTDCESIVTSTKWKLFEYISFGDLALVFFIVQLTLLLIFDYSTGIEQVFIIYKMGMWITFPVSIVSIFYQWKIEERWCILCLSIILILNIQCILLYVFIDSGLDNLTIPIILAIVLVLLIVLFAWKRIKKLKLELTSIKLNQIKALRLSKNFSFFKYILHQSLFYYFPRNEKSIFYKSENSKHLLTIITSPLCGHCRALHLNLAKNFKKICKNIDIHIVFNTDTYSNDINIYRYFHFLSLENNFEKFHDEYLKFMLFNDKDRLMKIHEINNNKIDKSFDNIIQEQRKFCFENDTLFTPLIFIDNQKYPSEFDKDHLIHFLLEFSEA